MIAFMSGLQQCNIEATDGEMGKVQDLYMDDLNWQIRYVLVDTWKSLPGRRVLLSTDSISKLDLVKEQLIVTLDKATIRNSPQISERTNLSFETEGALSDYYGWTKYWIGNLLEDEQSALTDTDDRIEKGMKREAHGLRSHKQVQDCRVHAANGRLGKIVDAVFDTETWALHSFVIQLKYQPDSGFLLVSPKEFISSEWAEGDLYLEGLRESFLTRPIYHTRRELNEYLKKPLDS